MDSSVYQAGIPKYKKVMDNYGICKPCFVVNLNRSVVFKELIAFIIALAQKGSILPFACTCYDVEAFARSMGIEFNFACATLSQFRQEVAQRLLPVLYSDPWYRYISPKLLDEYTNQQHTIRTFEQDCEPLNLFSEGSLSSFSLSHFPQ